MEQTNFGEMLRAARERRGLTLKQVSENTKISRSTLTALEGNDVEVLPGGLFIRAFVRAYAAEVHLDPEDTVTALLNAFPDQRVAKRSSGDFSRFNSWAPDTVAKPRDEIARSMHGAERPGMGDTVIGVIVVTLIVIVLLLFLALRGGDDTADEGTTAPLLGLVTDPTAASPDPTPAARATSPPRTGSPPVVARPSPVTLASVVGALSVTVHPTGPCWVSLTVDGERVFAGWAGLWRARGLRSGGSDHCRGRRCQVV